MPVYLLGLTRRRWDRDDEEYKSWLAADQVPAEVYRDLRTDESKLSVWHIEDDRSNLSEVVTALAINRRGFSHYDYGLIDPALVSSSGIKTEQSMGETPIPSANRWHRDLIELTVDRLSTLIKSLFGVMPTYRILRPRVRELILAAVEANEVERNRLPVEMQQDIEKVLSRR